MNPLTLYYKAAEYISTSLSNLTSIFDLLLVFFNAQDRKNTPHRVCQYII